MADSVYRAATPTQKCRQVLHSLLVGEQSPDHGRGRLDYLGCTRRSRRHLIRQLLHNQVRHQQLEGQVSKSGLKAPRGQKRNPGRFKGRWYHSRRGCSQLVARSSPLSLGFIRGTVVRPCGRITPGSSCMHFDFLLQLCNLLLEDKILPPQLLILPFHFLRHVL